MLSAKNISYSIGGKALLGNVSVAFEPGKLNLIIGPNGAGKSTLVKLLANQLAPQQGQIYYGNTDLKNIGIAQLACIRAVLSQSIELAFPLTVAEVVMMGRYPHFTGKPEKKDKTAMEQAMRFFDVWDMADRNYLTLSGGEKQRVNFARVAAQIWQPVKDGYRYLLLDEPLTFLDIYYQYQFMYKIQELLQSSDIVVAGVVHDLNLAAKFAHHLVLLHHGKVLAAGDKQQVLTVENIHTAYRLLPVIRNDGDGLHLSF
ncbi:MAG: heme ABC transporter ATP-binding protein [Chitinophagales bacterium]|nr:heme ABC transporter ATP-binding protein [Chitinophagales bacterium]